MTLKEKWLSDCRVCPRFCRINRNDGETGDCHIGRDIYISSSGLHFGEEPMLVGYSGSGTVFMTSCNLNCVFCQNYDISQHLHGNKVSLGQLALIMLNLQEKGACNINLVSPTHQAPQIFDAVRVAKQKGLSIPIVYNCGGYENPGFLKDLQGLVDIYMPDLKYSDDVAAEKYSGVKQYTQFSQSALLEMHRQVGDLQLDRNGLARKGLLIRHLLMPNNISGTKKILEFIAGKVSKKSYINIMDQYYPAFKAFDYPEISNRINKAEWQTLVRHARQLGLNVIT